MSSKRLLNLDGDPQSSKRTKRTHSAEIQVTKYKTIPKHRLSDAKSVNLTQHQDISNVTRYERLMSIHQCDITYDDREWLRRYVEAHNISKDGKCYCIRECVKRTVENPNSKYRGLEYYSCKYQRKACGFFRWVDYEEYLRIKKS